MDDETFDERVIVEEYDEEVELFVVPKSYKGKKAYFYKWYTTPAFRVKHQSQKDLADFLAVSESTVRKWIKNSEEDLQAKRSESLYDVIINDAMKPNADTATRKLAAEIMGLRKKDEEKYEPGAEDYSLWFKELINRLKQNWVQSGGICPVCSGHQVLFSEIRMDSEQEHGSNGQMDDMAVPDGSD